MRTMSKAAALAIGATLAACGGTIKVLDGVEVRCPDGKVRVLNQKGHPLETRPEPVHACRGTPVTLTFDNSVPRSQAHTRNKSGTTAAWLDVDNMDERTMTINVDPQAVPKMEYKYLLTIDGLGTLDPRIVVQ
jgi:hypothetical protein